MKEAGQLVATLFMSREQAHRAHLKTKSFAQHIALGEFYEGIVDMADSFAETAQGMYGIIDIPYLQPTAGDITDVLEKHATAIDKCRKCFSSDEESALLNIIDEIGALYARTLYKLHTLR